MVVKIRVIRRKMSRMRVQATAVTAAVTQITINFHSSAALPHSTYTAKSSQTNKNICYDCDRED